LPPRDEQDYETRRQQIIDGALSVFASKGFEKATNKDIARAAKIGSPGLIYHYFKDKSDLFRQVMEERAAIWQLLNHPEEIMDKPPREALLTFSSTFIKMLDNRVAVAMIKLLLSEAIHHPHVAEMFTRIGPGRGLAILSAYLSAQMDKGTLRRMDPGIAARCFVGPLIAYVLTREVFVLPDSTAINPEIMVTTAVDVFLRGMGYDEGRKTNDE
jgi:AcrR family transcriptional regulator